MLIIAHLFNPREHCKDTGCDVMHNSCKCTLYENSDNERFSFLSLRQWAAQGFSSLPDQLLNLPATGEDYRNAFLGTTCNCDNYVCLRADTLTTPPYIVSGCDGGPVDKSHVVYLACDTPDAQILYTTDGTVPQLHLPDVKVN
jgi:hypothetical protein